MFLHRQAKPEYLQQPSIPRHTKYTLSQWCHSKKLHSRISNATRLVAKNFTPPIPNATTVEDAIFVLLACNQPGCIRNPRMQLFFCLKSDLATVFWPVLYLSSSGTWSQLVIPVHNYCNLVTTSAAWSQLVQSVHT